MTAIWEVPYATEKSFWSGENTLSGGSEYKSCNDGNSALAACGRFSYFDGVKIEELNGSRSSKNYFGRS